MGMSEPLDVSPYVHMKFKPDWNAGLKTGGLTVTVQDAWLRCEHCDFRALFPRRLSGRRARGLRLIHRGGGQHYATWTYRPRKPRGLRKHLRRQKQAARG